MQEARAVGCRGRAPGIERCLQQRECAEHVGLQECLGVGDGAIDVGLGGEMGDTGEAVFIEQAAHQIRVSDVALDEGDAAIGDQRLEAADVGGIRHGIDHDQAVVGPCGTPRMHEVLADKAGASGNQNPLHPNLRREW